MTARRCIGMAALLALTACGNVAYRVSKDAPAPRTIAVLPLQGQAPIELRDAARQLLHSRLVRRGYTVAELAWVDRVLSERGWLRDPENVAIEPGRIDELLAALRVDAVMLATDFDESKLNIVLLRRHALSGSCALRGAGGREHWSAEHGVSRSGGFLIASGQAFTELKNQIEHGSDMASLALADELIADLVDTIPGQSTPSLDAATPWVDKIVVQRTLHGGRTRLAVTASASSDCALRFALPAVVDGVPMVATAPDGERFAGQFDLPADTTIHRVTVRARDRFGREAVAEVAL